jgi:short-subunit dehydrogenase involved in D-alanine esterification of teichoic acids
LEKHNDINVVINNAGIQNNYNWLDEQDGHRKIENEIQINFTSPMQIVYGLLPILALKQTAAIVNISSGLALAPKNQRLFIVQQKLQFTMQQKHFVTN